MNHLQKKLEKLEACDAAIKWAGTQKSLKEAWTNCPRADWMLWLLNRIRYDRVKMRLIGAWCARNTPLEDGRTT